MVWTYIKTSHTCAHTAVKSCHQWSAYEKAANMSSVLEAHQKHIFQIFVDLVSENRNSFSLICTYLILGRINLFNMFLRPWYFNLPTYYLYYLWGFNIFLPNIGLSSSDNLFFVFDSCNIFHYIFLFSIEHFWCTEFSKIIKFLLFLLLLLCLKYAFYFKVCTDLHFFLISISHWHISLLTYGIKWSSKKLIFPKEQVIFPHSIWLLTTCWDARPPTIYQDPYLGYSALYKSLSSSLATILPWLVMIFDMF